MKVITCTTSAVSLFFIIIQYFLIPISNANPSVDDKAFIAFMKGHPNVQISEYSKQKYEAHLGIMYFMRKNWQCAKIAQEFDKYERTKCQKYRKYLDILYEYLCREYVGIPAVKPEFVFKKKQIEINGPIIYAVNCLVKISQFYFNSVDEDLYSEYKLNKHFINYNNFEPILFNEKRLNYEFELKNELKMPINEMILQLAMNTANEWPKDGILDGIIRQNFNNNLRELLNKAEEKAKEEKPSRAYKINNDKHKIILYSKFDDPETWITDAFFSEFTKRNEFEYHVGQVYSMRKNWQCDKIGKVFVEKCQKYRKYLQILFDYLFRLYVEDKNAELANKFPAVKPIFMDSLEDHIDLIKVICRLNHNWKYYKDFIWEMNLANEEELNYEIKNEKNWTSKFKQKAMEITKGIKIVEDPSKNENETNIIANLRTEFDQKMKRIYERES